MLFLLGRSVRGRLGGGWALWGIQVVITVHRAMLGMVIIVRNVMRVELRLVEGGRVGARHIAR